MVTWSLRKNHLNTNVKRKSRTECKIETNCQVFLLNHHLLTKAKKIIEILQLWLRNIYTYAGCCVYYLSQKNYIHFFFFFFLDRMAFIRIAAGQPFDIYTLYVLISVYLFIYIDSGPRGNHISSI